MLDDEGRQEGKEADPGRPRAGDRSTSATTADSTFPAWITTGILDYVSPANTMYANHNAQWEEFSSLMKGT